MVERSNHPNYFLVQLGMVAFNEETSRPPGENKGQYCYYENLAFATSDTKEYFKKWYHGLAGEGFSDYTNAFSTAFMYFNNSRSCSKGSSTPEGWSGCLFRFPKLPIPRFLFYHSRAFLNLTQISFGLTRGLKLLQGN